MNVVPYNPYALLLWDAHVRAMKVSKGLDCYLVKYIVKEEPTFGLYILGQNEVQWYLETWVINAPEVTAIQSPHAICNSNIGVIYVDTNMPNCRVEILKPQDIVAGDNKESEKIYDPSSNEFNMQRPKTQMFEQMLYPVYTSQYNRMWCINVLKYAQDMMIEALDNNVVYRRRATLIP